MIGEKRIDLKMLKEKNRILELRHAMKRAHAFSGPEESSIPTRFQSIKRPKKEPLDRKWFRRLDPKRKVQRS